MACTVAGGPCQEARATFASDASASLGVTDRVSIPTVQPGFAGYLNPRPTHLLACVPTWTGLPLLRPLIAAKATACKRT